MADPRFFDRAGPYSLAELAALSGARLAQPADAGRLFSDVAPLEAAGPDDVTFLDNRKYGDAFARSRAGAAFVDERSTDQAPAGMALLVTPEPYKAFARAAQAFYPARPVLARRAVSAVIDPTAMVPLWGKSPNSLAGFVAVCATKRWSDKPRCLTPPL